MTKFPHVHLNDLILFKSGCMHLEGYVLLISENNIRVQDTDGNMHNIKWEALLKINNADEYVSRTRRFIRKTGRILWNWINSKPSARK